MIGSSPLIWYAIAYGGSATVLKAAGFLLFMWLARSMSVEEYGRFGLLYAVQTGVAALAMAGISEAVVGHLKGYGASEARQTLFASANTVFVVAGIVSAIVLTASVFTFVTAESEQSFTNFGFAVLAGITTAFLTLQAGIVRLDEHHVASLSLNFVGPMLGLVGGCLGFYLERTAGAFFVGAGIVLALSVILFRSLGVGFHSISKDFAAVEAIARAMPPFVVIAFFGWLSGYGGNYIVQGLFSSIEVAKFTFVFSLSSVMQLVASSLNQVWSPRFYKIAGVQTDRTVEDKNHRFFRWQGIAMGAVGGALIALFPMMVDLLGGNLIAYRAMTLELLVLFLGYMVLVPWWHAQNYFLLHRRGQDLMRIILVTSVIGLAGAFALMVLLGPIGIYLGFLFQMVVRMLGAVRVANKAWSLAIAWDGVAIGSGLLILGFLFARTS